jgi:hypothetical protein
VTLRTFTALATGVLALMLGRSVAGRPLSGAGPADATVTPSASSDGIQPLKNMAQLNWLGDQITPPAQPGHTTYRIGQQPSINVLWT